LAKDLPALEDKTNLHPLRPIHGIYGASILAVAHFGEGRNTGQKESKDESFHENLRGGNEFL
jgi:hypothetical protein